MTTPVSLDFTMLTTWTETC